MTKRPDRPYAPSLRKCGESHDGPDPALDSFFAWLSRQPRNTPERQVELAREYQATRLAFWSAVLTHVEGDQVRAAITTDAQARGETSCVVLTHALRYDVGLALSKRWIRLAPREHAAMLRARKVLCESNLRLVVTIAKRYRAPKDPLVTLAVTLPFADLIQEGTEGLLKACDRFDPDMGFRFSTYGTWWIRHAINRALVDKARLVRIPTHIADKLGKIARAETAFAAEHGHPPTDDELAKLANVAVRKIEQALIARAASRPIPLHGDPDEDEASSDVGDRIARLSHDDAADIENAILCEVDFDGLADSPAVRAHDALDALAPTGTTDAWRRNARAALEMRWGIRPTPGNATTSDDGPSETAGGAVKFDDIGAALGVSREQARKWVERGEKFCREWLTAAGRSPQD